MEDADLKGSEIWRQECHFRESTLIHIAAPSGSGKTSLALFLYGLSNSYSGEIRFNDQSAGEMDINNWAAYRREEVAVIFQDLRLFTAHTGRENIRVKASLTGYADDQEINEMAADLGVLDILDKPCSKMSQGERQRIAIIRGLCQPFQWLIMDEPFSHLDEGNIQQALNLIAEKISKQGAGLIALQLGPDRYFEYDKNYRM